jgi:hypothetical protein
LSDFSELEFSPQIFEKYSNIKFCGNPSDGNRVVLSGLTDEQEDGRTERERQTSRS